MTDLDSPPPARAVSVWTYTAIAALVIIIMTQSLVLFRDRQPEPLRQPVTVTACEPEWFNETGSCKGGPKVEPGVLELTPDLTIPVAGRTIIRSDEEVGYHVTVSWVAVESEAEFAIIDTPVTWEPGRDEAYEIPWGVPPQLLAIAEGLQPGESLGRWRIVGRAVPVDPTRYATYQWDSVETFELVNGSGL